LEQGNTSQGRGRRRRVFVVSALCILLAIGLVALWPREREPEYNGKPLSVWLALYADHPTNWTFAQIGGHMTMSKFQRLPGVPSPDEAAEAIRKIGTNALPFLLKWINYEPPAWKTWSLNTSTKLQALWRRIFHAQKSLTVVTYPPVAKTRADSASRAFYLFGREALPAVKRLNEIESDKTHPDASRRAWIALAEIGRSISNSEITNTPAKPEPVSLTNRVVPNLPQRSLRNGAKQF
jgi:hypothetical protein